MLHEPRLPRRRSRVIALIGLPSLVLLAACAGTTRIETILADPSAFDGREVTVEGEVTETLGVPLLGGTYDVSDGTGTLKVVSEGGVPREGADVRVVGTFRALFTLGAETLAVLQERERRVR